MKSITRDSVAEKLSLSNDQRLEIEDTLTATAESIQELRTQYKSSTDRESIKKQASLLRSEEQRKILAALNRKQRQDFIAMLGRKIDVSKLGHVRFDAPEIAGENEWINSPPLTLQQLKGKVVALHFFAFA